MSRLVGIVAFWRDVVMSRLRGTRRYEGGKLTAAGREALAQQRAAMRELAAKAVVEAHRDLNG